MTLAPRRGLSATLWAVLALLVATLLGHVCALPIHAHAHAATAETHQHGDESDGADHVAHIGSCEALASSPTVHPVVAGSSMAAWAAAPVEVASWVAHDRVAAPPPESPPRFLLHAALLT